MLCIKLDIIFWENITMFFPISFFPLYTLFSKVPAKGSKSGDRTV